MPEGNEIHRWAERHAAAFAGKTVRVDGPQGRFTDSDVLDGRKLLRVMAVGKHLGYDFGKDRILHVHLGLQGDFTEGSGPLPEVKGALRLRMWSAEKVRQPTLAPKGGREDGAPSSKYGVASSVVNRRHGWYSQDDGTGHLQPEQIAWVELRGPMDCTVYTQVKWEKLLERLGPDPLNGDAPDRALAKIAKSKKPIAALLMEQDVMAGIGNIYRAELLFRAGQSPFALGKNVASAVVKAMWRDAVPLMRAGMVDRRIVTTKAKDRPTKKAGQALKEEAHYVYRRQGKPCFICGTKVLKQENFAGRNLYWCPVCQAQEEA
jgi:endonuclease VIII